MQDVIKWLESPEGEDWSHKRHVDDSVDGDRMPIALVTIKDDVAEHKLDATILELVWVA